MQVMTTKGMLDRSVLDVRDVVHEDSNSRAIASEWFLGEELVRRDVAVSILAPLPITSEAGAV